MVSKKKKKMVGLINLLLAILGIALLGSGFGFFENDIRNVFVSIGCSVIASSVIGYLSTKYLMRESSAKDIVLEWGLIKIYERRNETNPHANSLLEKLKGGEVFVCPMTFNGFFQVMSEQLEEKLRNKEINIKFLIINPDNKDIIKQRALDEHKSYEALQEQLMVLKMNLDDLKGKYPTNVEYKLYNHLPLNYYYMIGDTIFVGPFLCGLESKYTITYEYKKGGMGYNYWHHHYMKLYNNTNVVL